MMIGSNKATWRSDRAARRSARPDDNLQENRYWVGSLEREPILGRGAKYEHKTNMGVSIRVITAEEAAAERFPAVTSRPQRGLTGLYLLAIITISQLYHH